MRGTSGQPLSCAVSWGVARRWQPLERPTLAPAEARSSWIMSNAAEMRAPCSCALISAGTSTTVTTARMPASCASHCDPDGSALRIKAKEPVGELPVLFQDAFLCQLQFLVPLSPRAWERRSTCPAPLTVCPEIVIICSRPSTMSQVRKCGRITHFPLRELLLYSTPDPSSLHPYPGGSGSL